MYIMFLYYIIVYSFTSQILKFYEDLVVNLLTKQPSLNKKKIIQIFNVKYIYTFLYPNTCMFICSNFKKEAMQSSFADKILHMFLI